MFRRAAMIDLPQIKVVYQKLIERMNQDGIEIWDDIYPCDFFAEDIEKDCLYVLMDEETVVSAFALCDSNGGDEAVQWENAQAKSIYIDRFGVNVDYARKGIGSRMLDYACETAREKGVDYLKLFVVDINSPAIRLYEKNGFIRVAGIYDEVIDEELTLHEYGFEKYLR